MDDYFGARAVAQEAFAQFLWSALPFFVVVVQFVRGCVRDRLWAGRRGGLLYFLFPR